jgi:probable F420-dependent oxidoreductase
MKLEKLGVWASVDNMTAADGASFAKRVETWGYAALWTNEALGRDVLVHSAWLLGNTERLVLASGIANIYARDATAMVWARDGLAEQSDGRFLLGIGLSHAVFVEKIRGHNYGRPVTTMRDYLIAMSRVTYRSPPPSEKPLTIIAALGPKMLELAAEHADGAHPYNVTPEHTATARSILGPGKLLCVEQKVLLESSPDKARAVGRQALAPYLSMPNYLNSWRHMGFGEIDFAGEGSDRLIDAIIAWGDEAAIRRRIQAHWDAGADHVCIQAIDPTGVSAVEERVLALLAPKA